MRISKISILDTYGTRSAVFAPGTLTRISGPNGSGKSSILRALAKVFEGGTDPSVVRAGAERSVVEITLDDGTIINRTCRPKRKKRGDESPVEWTTEVVVTQPDGLPRGAPQSYIQSLGDATAVDPASILRIDTTTVPGRKALAELLLQIVNVSFQPDELATALAAEYRAGAGIRIFSSDLATLSLPAVAAALDLDGLKKYSAQVTELRRRTGQTRDDSDGAVNRLQKALPEGTAEDQSKNLVEAEDYRRAVERAFDETRLGIERDHDAWFQVLGSKHERELAEATTAAREEIHQIEQRLADKALQLATAFTGDMEAANQAKEKALTDLLTEARPKLDRAIADVGRLKEAVAAQQRSTTLRQEIETQLEVCRSASRKYDLLTEVLLRLEDLRKTKLDSLPVQGLEVSGDTVTVDGIPWQNVNTSKRIEVALQLCALRAGKLPVLFIDDCEHLDSETRSLLEEEIAKAGFQLLEAVVSDADGLTIETVQ